MTYMYMIYIYIYDTSHLFCLYNPYVSHTYIEHKDYIHTINIYYLDITCVCAYIYIYILHIESVCYKKDVPILHMHYIYMYIYHIPTKNIYIYTVTTFKYTDFKIYAQVF